MSVQNNVVKLVRRVTKMSFDLKESKINSFAKEFVKSKDSLKAYNTSFEEINKVRASSLLLETETWEAIIYHIRYKKDKDIKEAEIINLYDLITETFQISPFAIFDIYVHKQSDDQTLAEKMAISSNLVFSSLLYAHHFFRILEREYFYRLTFMSLKNQLEIMKMFGQSSEIQAIINAAKKDDIDSYELFEK
jgi:hypothetical protein